VTTGKSTTAAGRAHLDELFRPDLERRFLALAL
jgi:hypothetical protein